MRWGKIIGKMRKGERKRKRKKGFWKEKEVRESDRKEKHKTIKKHE